MNMKNSLKTGHLCVLFRRAGVLREAARSVRALGLARRARRDYTGGQTVWRAANACHVTE